MDRIEFLKATIDALREPEDELECLPCSFGIETTKDGIMAALARILQAHLTEAELFQLFTELGGEGAVPVGGLTQDYVEWQLPKVMRKGCCPLDKFFKTLESICGPTVVEV